MPGLPDESNAAPNHATPEQRKPRDTKRTGEVSEAAFLHKVVGLGLRVTKPWGDSERYDFVVDAGGRLWRVQIKCTAAERPSGGYRIHTTHSAFGKGRIPYTAADIDVLAAHIIPLDLWYVVPCKILTAARLSNFTLTVSPNSPASKNITKLGGCPWRSRGCRERG
jgi:hypothetical protein